MFSKACEYGIKATIFVAKQSLEGKRTNLKEISGAIASPEAYTAKILQSLVKNQIIYSTKGVNGGFEMDSQQFKTLKLHTIVVAIDGNDLLTGCVLGLTECSDKNPCPMHEKYLALKKHIGTILHNTSISELVDGINFNFDVLKI